jgi:hypothetical protein
VDPVFNERDKRSSGVARRSGDDTAFKRVVAATSTHASPAAEWTCRVLAGGRKPALVYWYRFADKDGNGSRIGRTRTAPDSDDPRPLSFAFVSCRSVTQGAQNAYRRMIFEDERAPEADRSDSSCISATSSMKSPGIPKIALRECTTAKSARSTGIQNVIPEVGQLLREYIGKRTCLLFSTKKGKPLCQSNILRRQLHLLQEELKIQTCGAHAFRRFRITHLRKNSVPEGLLQHWAGHSGKTITDGYDKVKDDLEFRKQVCKSVGLGFTIPAIPAAVVQNVQEIKKGLAGGTQQVLVHQ